MAAGQKQSIGAEISNRVASLHRQYFGLGPPRAKTYIAGEVVLCVLEDGASHIERGLQARGLADRARRVRMDILHTTAETDLRKTVEAVTGSTVKAFVGGYNPEVDVTTLTFLLAPPRSEGEIERDAVDQDRSVPESTNTSDTALQV
jgi:uncharacterized protein YbcI